MHLKNSIALYDLHLTYNVEVKKEMEGTYNIPTAILPFGFDIGDELFKRCSSQKEILKACFLGNPDIYRAEFLTHLAKEGIELDVYGNDWDQFVNHPKIKISKPVYGDDFWLALAKYRVQLNLMRPHNPYSHNMRTFEVPGVGGIQLAPATPDHQLYFEADKEIYLYTDIKESINQIKKILALSPGEANAVREKARQRSLLSGYTYKHRSKQLLQQIRKLYE